MLGGEQGPLHSKWYELAQEHHLDISFCFSHSLWNRGPGGD